MNDAINALKGINLLNRFDWYFGIIWYFGTAKIKGIIKKGKVKLIFNNQLIIFFIAIL